MMHFLKNAYSNLTTATSYIKSIPSVIKNIVIGGAIATSAIYVGPVCMVAYIPTTFELYLAYSIVYKNLDQIGYYYDVGSILYDQIPPLKKISFRKKTKECVV